MNQLINTRLYGLLAMGLLLCSTAHAAQVVSLEKKTPAGPVTRAIGATAPVAPPAVAPTFTYSVYDQANNTLYLGADAANKGANALVSVKAPGDGVATITPLAIDAELTNKQINVLALSDSDVIVVREDEKQVAVWRKADGKVATSPAAIDPNTLADAATKEVQSAPVAVAGSGKLFFAVVADGQEAIKKVGAPVGRIKDAIDAVKTALGTKPIAADSVNLLSNDAFFRSKLATHLDAIGFANLSAGPDFFDAAAKAATAADGDLIADSAVTKRAAFLLSVRARPIATSIKQARLTTMATNVPDPLAAADVAAAAAYGVSAPADTLIDGAATALEAGTGWALRKAPAVGVVDIEALFNEGATAMETELGTNQGKKVAAYSALVLKDHGDTKTSVASEIAYDAAAGKEALALTKRVNEAATFAQAKAEDVVTPDNLAAKTAAVLVDTFNTDAAHIDIDNGHLQAAVVKDEAGIRGDAIAVVTDDQAKLAVVAALEAALAQEIGIFKLAGANSTGDVAASIIDDMANDLNKPAATSGILHNFWNTELATKPVAKVVVGVIKDDIVKTDGTGTLKAPLFNLISTTFDDATDGRRVQAAVEAQTKAIDATSAVVAAVKEADNPTGGGGGTATAAAVVAAVAADTIKTVSGTATLADAAAAAAATAVNSNNSGAAVALIGTLGWGVRNAIIGQTADDVKTEFVVPMLARLAAIPAFGGGGTNSTAGETIGRIAAASAEGGAARDAIATVIVDAVQTGAKAAVVKAKAEFDTNGGAFKTLLTTLVNNVVGIDATKIATAVTTGAAIADPATVDAKTISQTLDANAAAAKAFSMVVDVGAGDDSPALGAAAAELAALGWGVRANIMDTDDATVIATLHAGTNDKVLDKLVDGGTWADPNKPLAKAAATIIKDKAGAAADEPTRTLVGIIKAALLQGTTVASQELATRLHDQTEEAGDVITKAAAALKIDSAALVGGGGLDGTRIGNAAIAANAGAAAAVAVTGPVNTTDTPANGAIAAIEAALGWAIKNAVVTGGARGFTTDSNRNEGPNRGLAILKSDLKLADPTNVTTVGNAALKLDLAAKADNDVDRTVALYGDTVAAANRMNYALLEGNPAVTTHWSTKLGRLYIGLNGLGRGMADNPLLPTKVTADETKDGGVISLLVAGVDGTKAFIKPVVVDPTAAALGGADADAVQTQLVGFNADNTLHDAFRTVMNHIRTMHTSTDKDYVIFNGGVTVNAGDPNSWLFALPVMPKGHANAGQLAKINLTGTGLELIDATAAPGDVPKVDWQKTSLAYDPAAGTAGHPDAFTAAEARFVVGADPRFIGGALTDNVIQRMEVVGNTVYVSLAGDRTAAGDEAGIWASTALFDTNGLIRAWTPWQRVAGSITQATGAIDKALGFGLSTKTAGFVYLDAAHLDTVKATAWGESVNVADAGESRALTTVLNAIFPTGVTRIVNFDEKTPGFRPGEFSMMVAVGGDTVALIQTGVKPAGGVFTPTKKFEHISATPNVFVFNSTTNPALAAIAPLTGAEVLRSSAVKEGYLYVAGLGGVARLEHAVDQKGWFSSSGLAKLTNAGAKISDFPGAPAAGAKPANYSFRQLDTTVFGSSSMDNLAAVTALAANGVKLVAVGFNKLVETDNNGGAAKTHTITGGQDIVLTDKLAIVATNDGLYQQELAAMGDAPTKVAATTGITGIPTQLAFVPTKKGGLTDGNLFVLFTDQASNAGTVHLFNVQGTDIKTITGVQPIDLGYREFFTIDGGGVMLDALRQSPDNDKLTRTKVGGADVSNLTDFIGVDQAKEATNFAGRPVRDTASGAWVVPGSWGVRVQE